MESSQENYDLLMYGIEGEHYTLKGDNLVLPKTQVSNNSYFFPGWWGSDAFMNIELMRGFSSDPLDYKENYVKNSELNCVYAPANGFVPDYESLGEMFGRRSEAFDELENAIASPLSADSVDVDELRKQQRTMGADNIAEMLQKQIAEWKNKSNNVY